MNTETQQQHRFGVHSEFGTLREVMVGRLDDFAYPRWHPNIRYLGGETAELLKRADEPTVYVKDIVPEIWEQAHEQLENVVSAFEKDGVKVHRPRCFTEEEKEYLATLQGGHSLLYPADPVFVLGDHFIETCTRRWFRRRETWAIRDVIKPMIDADPEARHVSIPRAQPSRDDDCGPGPFLEGGDIIILGKDLLVGHGPLTSNLAGVDWLRRYIEPFGYKVHPVELQGDYLHLLGVMCLLREGLLMAYLPALGNVLPDLIADWDVIDLTLEECLALGTVGMNLDRKRHMIDECFTRIMGELDKRGMEPVSMPMNYLSRWGGAVRCVTLPIIRDA